MASGCFKQLWLVGEGRQKRKAKEKGLEKVLVEFRFQKDFWFFLWRGFGFGVRVRVRVSTGIPVTFVVVCCVLCFCLVLVLVVLWRLSHLKLCSPLWWCRCLTVWWAEVMSRCLLLGTRHVSSQDGFVPEIYCTAFGKKRAHDKQPYLLMVGRVKF